MPIALRLKNDLDVLFSTPVVISLRAPYIHGPLRPLATKIGEKPGLGFFLVISATNIRLAHILLMLPITKDIKFNFAQTKRCKPRAGRSLGDPVLNSLQYRREGENTRMAGSAKTMDQAVKAMTEKEGKYLTFKLAGEEYGIGILKIKEIIGMMPVTTVPRTPPFVKGVINLRGKVIPVMDLRLRFGMEETDYTERTCIIVVEIETGSGTVLIGTVVDSVSEVLNIKGEDIEEPPTFGASLDTDYILGMAKVEKGVKILLDIDRVLSEKEIATLEDVN
jgi:purine-binding chemotaxis protein CheW